MPYSVLSIKKTYVNCKYCNIDNNNNLRNVSTLRLQDTV